LLITANACCSLWHRFTNITYVGCATTTVFGIIPNQIFLSYRGFDAFNAQTPLVGYHEELLACKDFWTQGKRQSRGTLRNVKER